MNIAKPVLKLIFGLENHGSSHWDLHFMKIQDINLMLGACRT